MLPATNGSPRRSILSRLGWLALGLSLAAVIVPAEAETDALTQPAASAKPAAAGDKADAADKTNKAGRPMRELPAFTPEREAAALTFVSSHHPELAPLLAGLKLSRPQEYQRAIRKLFADSERLAQIRETQPKQYEIKLREWKLESRVQLLVARLTMERTPALEAELRAALEEQLSVHRELLVHERDRAQQKAAALDREIAEIDADRQRAVTERFNRAVNSAGQRKSGMKSGRNEDKPSVPSNNEIKKATP